MDDIYTDFWLAFLEETHTDPTVTVSRYTYFGQSEEESVSNLEQLLSGEKTAISHCIPDYLTKKQPLPRIGDYTMVTDFYGNPCCILQAVDVLISPLPEVPEAWMRREHPGAVRDAWLAEKLDEYKDLAARGAFHANAENPILLEEVRVAYPVRFR